MKLKQYVLKNGGLILAITLLVGLTLGAGLTATAAPGAAPAAQIPGGAPMPALTEAVCLEAGGTRTCDIWALAGSVTMPDTTVVPIWGFAVDAASPATVPGPVIRANVGETLVINLHNEIAGENVSLAFPGLDGLVPDVTGVAQGGMATYTFVVPQAGTFLYEAGLTEGGARQATMGLAGPLIVTDPLAAPVWTQEIVLFFNTVDPDFSADPVNYPMNQFHPRYWLMNGLAWPNTGWIDVAAGSTVLMRYLNGGIEHHAIEILGLNQEVIAADGEAVPFSRGAITKGLGAGQTAETLVTIPALAATDTLYALYHSGLSQHNNNQRLADGRAAFGGQLVFLHVTAGGVTPLVGPTASNVWIDPPKTTGAGGVVLNATLTDADGVTACEYFVNVGGAGGTGIACTVIGGAVAEAIAEVDVLAWPSGANTLYVRGQDTLGNWGTLGSAVVVLDNVGPEVYGVHLHPDANNGTHDALINATADEMNTGGSPVVAGQYRINGGTWVDMNLNLPGSTFTELNAIIPAGDILALGEGPHLLEVQAQDDLMNWTAVPGTTTIIVDLTGPNVTAINLSPNTLDFTGPVGVTSVKLTGTVEDALNAGVQSILANAEGFIDVAGTPGTGFPLFPSDGLFDESIEDVYFNMPISHFRILASGPHDIFISGLDAAGNWGPATPATITINAVLFDGGKARTADPSTEAGQ